MRVPMVSISAVCALIAGCQSPQPNADDLWRDSAAGVGDPALASVCSEEWQQELRDAPSWATSLGDPRYHGELEDPSPAAEHARIERERAVLARLAALSLASLGVQDRITEDELAEHLRLRLAEYDSGIDPASWNVDARGGPQNEFLTLASDQPLRSSRERDQLLERWSKMPGAIDATVENLRRGLAHGRVASKKQVQDTLDELDHVLATPAEKSPLCEMAKNDARFLARIVPIVRERIYPAFARYRAFLASELLPRARDDDHPGLCNVAGGDAWYRLRIQQQTSLDLPPREIHDFGLAEIARLRRAMGELGQKLFGTNDLAAIRHRLRDDPAEHFQSAEAILAAARERLARAQAAVPAVFGRLPKTPCEVTPIPEHEAAHTTIAYYKEPAADGSRPGRYYVNTSAPTTRPIFEASVLAFHESVPGHHLQIALQQELSNLPAVRRHHGQNAFVEGWGLYCETLADELGLYTSDRDRLGMLAYDAWRSARLVVDTGMHAFGWSRARAIAYMEENTLLEKNNIQNEIDRYIAWPAQALGYKLGKRDILSLREEARSALGARFTLSAFHDRVLENGAVSLATLRERVSAWISREKPTALPVSTGSHG